jgi:hypothetical protein
MKIQSLRESSLSRLHKYLTNYDVCFISGFKSPVWVKDHYEGVKSPRDVAKVNRDRNNNLLRNIKSCGYDSVKVDGHYENQERKQSLPDDADSKFYTDKEESFAVISKNTSDKGFEVFITNMLNLCRKYDQESILVFKSGTLEGQFYYADGSVEPGGSAHFGKDNSFKSMVKGRPFVVESVSDIQDHTIRTRSMYDRYRK